jgi:uncharacterized membrane protein (UPF0127 family)
MRHRPLYLNRAALAALFLVAVAVGLPAFGDAPFKNARLKIETQNGQVLLDVEVADTEPQREHGLMFRRQLPEDHGMIFLFGDEREITMWMKNTYIPLDMIFIGNDWHIVHIARDAEPLSTDIISSIQPASRVLEILAGQADKLGLKPGDTVSLLQ